MPKIIIMNQGTGHARGYDPIRSEPLRKSVGRCMWLANQGDIIISPIHVEHEFLCSIANLLDFNVDSITVVVMDHLRAEGLLLSPSDIQIIKEIVSKNNGDWFILPCFWTPDIADFCIQLGLGDPVTLAFAAQRGPDLFNRKSHFRQFSAGASIPIPEGSVVQSAAELGRAIERHLPCTGTVIVKKDDSAGGLGNITITNGAIRVLPGSRETRAFGNSQAQAQALWEELTDSTSHNLVVEAYHEFSYSYYFEYFIGDDGISRYMHSGDVRIQAPDDASSTELVWIGLDTPTTTPHGSLADALSHSYRLVNLMATIGCRGHINIDAIVTTGGDVLFNESNLRWGGGTSLHSIGQCLLGKEFANEHALCLVRNIKCPPRPEAERRLENHELAYSTISREGVIILAADEHESNTMECLIIAKSRTRARELETAIYKVMD